MTFLNLRGEEQEPLPVKYYKEGGITHAVYGSSSIDYVEELRKRLEISPDHTVDGIQARDATIQMLDRQIESLKAQIRLLQYDADAWTKWLAAQTLVQDEFPENYYIELHCEKDNFYISLYYQEDHEIHDIEVPDWDCTSDFIVRALEVIKEREREAKR